MTKGGLDLSRKFGEIRQMAFVVRDIDGAMHYWSQLLGIGPFFIKRNIIFSNYVFRGRHFDSPTVSIALSNSGFIQIELIQQHDDAPSIYKEFLDSGREGLQHVSSWMTTNDMMKRKQELVSQGVKVVQECVIPSSGVNLVYFDTDAGNGGFIYEIADLLEPVHSERILNIKNISASWDGEQPVREVGA